MGLTEYQRKRNFSVTAEPSGAKKPRPRRVAGASRFVIQKHDASRLHYDFRLEMDGVLKSWAVPKGIPWERGEKHLAVEVEDHPIDYEDFEGVIPAGSYGGGTVMVWDRGNYYVHGEKPLEALKEGRLHLVLEGEKLKGDWALIRTRSDGNKNQWLLLKSDANVKPISKKRDDQSAKTGRTMKQIAKDRDAEWQSNRDQPDETAKKSADARPGGGRAQGERDLKKKSRAPQKLEESALALPDSLPAGKPRFVAPMKPKLVETPPAGGGWIYELKFDGFRALALKRGGKVKLISRNENDLTKKFPEIAEALESLPCKECVIDGEVVALDEEGRSSFQLLQAREMEGYDAPLSYYVFDLLQLEGKNLGGFPLTTRKEMLRQLCAGIERADSLFRRARGTTRRRSRRSEATWTRRDHRQTGRFRLRSRPPERRLDQAQVPERAGICHRRLHSAGRSPPAFRRPARRLLRKKEAPLCRQSRDRLRHQNARVAP